MAKYEFERIGDVGSKECKFCGAVISGAQIENPFAICLGTRDKTEALRQQLAAGRLRVYLGTGISDWQGRLGGPYTTFITDPERPKSLLIDNVREAKVELSAQGELIVWRENDIVLTFPKSKYDDGLTYVSREPVEGAICLEPQIAEPVRGRLRADDDDARGEQ